MGRIARIQAACRLRLWRWLSGSGSFDLYESQQHERNVRKLIDESTLNQIDHLAKSINHLTKAQQLTLQLTNECNDRLNNIK